MNFTPVLIENIIPLYILIGLGYIAGRWLDVNLHSLARLAIFILTPLVNFGAIMQLKFDSSYVFLPFIVFGMATLSAIMMCGMAQLRWKDNTANLIGIGSVSGNTGYFGLPVAAALFGADNIGIYLMAAMGTLIAESSIGYYLAARGHHTIKDSIIKVLKLPTFHAFYLALILNHFGVTLPAIAVKYWTHATGAWIFIGMMMIGIALSKLQSFQFDWRLIRWIFTAKYLVWPTMGIGFILLDTHVLHLFNPLVYGLLLVLVSVPPPANLVAFAAQLNLHPEKAAIAVLLGTLLAIAFVPGFMALTTGLR